MLEPFGKGNELPVLSLEKLKIKDKRLLGKGEKHLKLWVSDENSLKTFEAIGFGFGENSIGLKVGDKIDFVVLKEGRPMFAVECKSGEKNIHPSLFYFMKRTSIPQFYQVHEGSRDYEKMVSESFRFTHFAGSFVCHEKMPLEDEDELKRWYKALNEYEGAFVENYVAQQLVSHFQQDLYYVAK